MKKQILITFVIVCLLFSSSLAFQVVGPATAVPGFGPTTTIAFNYVTSDAQFMLLQVWDPVWRIKSSTWNPVLNQWTAPQELPTDPAGGFPNWTGGSSLSPDGLTMYYPGITGISRSRKTLQGWTLPPEIITGVNTNPTSTYFNGTYLYSTYLGTDLIVSQYDPATDSFSAGIPVSSVNTAEWWEQGGWISHDNTLLLFESNRPGGYGGRDIWSATYDQSLQKWANITNLGPNVNTSNDEWGPHIAEQTGFLYFERYDSSTDLRQLMQAPVPEPATLFLLGLGGLVSRRALVGAKPAAARCAHRSR